MRYGEGAGIMAGKADEWESRNAEEDARQRRVDRSIEAEARQIRFFGKEPEPGLHNHLVSVVRPNRPAEHSMEAVQSGRVQVPEKHLPGLGPTLAEVSAQRRVDAAQELLIPKWPPVEREPIVSSPARMSDERNARLFPIGPGNDDHER